MVQAGEVDQRFIRQDQLVQGDIRGYPQATGLGLGDQGHAPGAGQLAEMRTHAALFHQQQITGQGHGFCGFRNARQAEEAGHRTFMGQAAFGQVAVLGMEDHRQVEGGRVFQGTAQGARAAKAFQAIAEGHATGVTQGDQFGKLLAVQALAQGANGKHFAIAGFAGAVQDQLGHSGSVQHRLGIGRATQAGHATGGSGLGFTGDVAFAAVARLAQGDIQVHQPRRGHQALGIDALAGVEACGGGADGDDLAGVQV